MLKFTSKLILIFVLLISIFASYIPASEAASKPALPKIKFVTSPKKEYVAGGTLKVTVQSTGYTGKVEYTAALYTQKGVYSSQAAVQLSGKDQCNISWNLYDKGEYKLVVKVKRAGIDIDRLANPKEICDSSVTSTYFSVKNKQVTISKEGSIYGAQNPETDKTEYVDLTVKAPATVCQYVTVNGDVYVNSNNVTLKDIKVTGTLYIDPGSDAAAVLDNVKADKIVILSGKPEGYDLKNVKARELVYNANNPMTLKVNGDTVINKTIVNKNVFLNSDGGRFGSVFLDNKGKLYLNVTVQGNFSEPLTVQTDSVITVSDENTFVGEIQIEPAGNMEINVQLNGKFNNIFILKPAVLSLTRGSFAHLIKAYREAYLHVEEGAEAEITEIEDNGLASLVVSGNGRIQEKSPFTKQVVGKEELPDKSKIIPLDEVQVYTGYQYNIISRSGYKVNNQPYLRLRPILKNGGPVPTKSGSYVYQHTGNTVLKYMKYSDLNIYSIKINKDDGTLNIPGGSHEMYIPAPNDGWYLLKFTTKQIGSSGERRSELTSVNGKAYKYNRWKAPASTKGLPYVTIGTVWNDVVKILGNPTKKYIDNYSNNAVYQYDIKNKTSYIYIQKVDGYFVVQGWRIEGPLKVSMGNADPKAAPFKLYSSKQEVVKAMGTPIRLEVGNGYEIWTYSGGEVKFFDDRVVAWENRGNLKVSIGTRNANAAPLAIGSTRQDVVRAMGTPTKIAYGDGFFMNEFWYYGESAVVFDENTGLVKRYDNKGNLKVSAGKKVS